MVPAALRVSPARPATSTFGAGDLGGASVVCPAAALAGGKGGHWRLRTRKWFPGQASSQSSVLCMWSTCRSVGHVPFISVVGIVIVVGGSR